MNTTKTILIDIIKENMPEDIDNIDVNSTLKNIGIDSIKLIVLLIELEKKGNFNIIELSKNADFSKIRTINDILILLDQSYAYKP